MTGDASPSHRLLEALRAEAIDRASRAAERLQAESVVDLLGRLADAVAAGRDEEAELLLEEVARTYESLRVAERTTLAAASTVRDRGLVDAETGGELTDTLLTASRTRVARTGMLDGVARLLGAEGDGPERSAVVDRIERVIDAEADLSESLSSAERRVERVDLRPRLAVVGTDVPGGSVAVGDRITLGVTVANVGDAPAGDVRLAVDAPDGLSVERTPVDIGSVAGTRSVSVGLTGTAPSVHSVEVTVRSSNAGRASETVTVVVSDRAGRTPPDDAGLARFDTNDSGRIEPREVMNALVAFNRGEAVGGAPVTPSALQALVAALNSGEAV